MRIGMYTYIYKLHISICLDTYIYIIHTHIRVYVCMYMHVVVAKMKSVARVPILPFSALARELGFTGSMAAFHNYCF